MALKYRIAVNAVLDASEFDPPTRRLALPGQTEVPKVGLKPQDQCGERQSREGMEEDRLNGGEMSEQRKDFESSAGPRDYGTVPTQRRLEEPNLVLKKREPESRAETESLRKKRHFGSPSNVSRIGSISKDTRIYLPEMGGLQPFGMLTDTLGSGNNFRAPETFGLGRGLSRPKAAPETDSFSSSLGRP
ncbi:hypothetical protein B0H11DRAFT_1909971 [Mycena galericulata]|nr:hypothetical protein B0H11DRAFT_1909971 [Mycena galericulata]